MKRWFDDLAVGEVQEYPGRTVTREEILAFAREFDPQSFHIDDDAARRSAFGGIVASGWHTAAICQRLVVDGLASTLASLGSPGVDELRWVRPVRPGDTLVLRVECVETRPSRSKPDRGLVRLRYELRNQEGDVVMTMIGMALVRRRPPAGETSLELDERTP